MPAPGRWLRVIRPGERGLALLLTLTYALALFGLYLLKPARDSLFLSKQAATDLPLAFILTLYPVPLSYAAVILIGCAGAAVALAVARAVHVLPADATPEAEVPERTVSAGT